MSNNRYQIPADRQAQILDWLEEEGSLSNHELQERLYVSHMTIHRDLLLLEQKGLVYRVRGGVMLEPAETDVSRREHRCIQCDMRIPHRSAVRLTSSKNEKLNACCPHCGILLMIGDQAIQSALARDFLYSRMTNMRQATYLVGSEIRACCVPGILCFASEEEATKFQKGFGGRVMSLKETSNHLASTHLPGQE